MVDNLLLPETYHCLSFNPQLLIEEILDNKKLSLLMKFKKIPRLLVRDAQVSRTTIHEYYQILKDTLIAHELPSWREGLKRKPVVP